MENAAVRYTLPHHPMCGCDLILDRIDGKLDHLRNSLIKSVEIEKYMEEGYRYTRIFLVSEMGEVTFIYLCHPGTYCTGNVLYVKP